MTQDLDQRERADLSDLFDELGPDAPTLSGAWTTADLAAHLVVRERNPLAMPGILFGGPFEGVTDRAMARERDRHGYAGVVERIRTGPPPGPMAVRPVGRLVNTIEYVVHHEDVRRPDGRGPRLDEALQDGIWALLGKAARLIVAPGHLGPVGLTLESDGRSLIVARREGIEGSATLRGAPVEVLLYLYGRKEPAEVALVGDPAAVEAVEGAGFGI